MGRKYGLLAYGRYSYDLFPVAWVPIPNPFPTEIWTPETGTSPPVETWTPVTFGSVEIWNPVTFPNFGPPNV